MSASYAQMGQLIIYLLMRISYAPTTVQIIDEISNFLGINKVLIQDTVCGSLCGGVRFGYLYKIGAKYYLRTPRRRPCFTRKKRTRVIRGRRGKSGHHKRNAEYPAGPLSIEASPQNNNQQAILAPEKEKIDNRKPLNEKEIIAEGKKVEMKIKMLINRHKKKIEAITADDKPKPKPKEEEGALQKIVGLFFKNEEKKEHNENKALVKCSPTTSRSSHKRRSSSRASSKDHRPKKRKKKTHK